jgi:aryl-alcohol dehydrogenase-like predicted oxidoreductase
MNYRTLGKTGLSVSEIGYGAWGIGGGMWQGHDDAESKKALNRAVDLGVNFFDTALVYGWGHSEGLVGELVRERKEQLIVASKIPPKNSRWPARKRTPLEDAFPPEHIIECTERSLSYLKLDHIDLQQFHVWTDDWVDRDEWREAVRQLKAAGKIRFFGVSINDHDPASVLKLVASGDVDTVQVIYNIFDQSPERELFPLCQKHSVGVIVRVPFDEGSLAGAVGPDTVFPEQDFRNRYFRGERKVQVVERVEKLRTLLGEEAGTLPELALRFCLHHPAVSTVIPGMRSVRNVEANCAVSVGRRLSDRLLESLRLHAWERNFYR